MSIAHTVVGTWPGHYCLYALLICIAYMHCLYALLICIAYMHCLYALLICTAYMHCLYALLTCIAYMHCLYASLLHRQRLLADALHMCTYGAQLQLQSHTHVQMLAMCRLILLQAMVKDHKLNSMLLPASKLKQMLRSHSMYSQNPAARCGFRVPNKRLW